MQDSSIIERGSNEEAEHTQDYTQRLKIRTNQNAGLLNTWKSTNEEAENTQDSTKRGEPIETNGQTLWYSRCNIIPLRFIPLALAHGLYGDAEFIFLNPTTVLKLLLLKIRWRPLSEARLLFSRVQYTFSILHLRMRQAEILLHFTKLPSWQYSYISI